MIPVYGFKGNAPADIATPGRFIFGANKELLDRFCKQAKHAGEPMDEGPLADGADFTVAEETRDRQRSEAFLHRPDIVMR